MRHRNFITVGFFDRDVDLIARELIGLKLTFEGVGGAIVETESYHEEDPASHSFGSKLTDRNAMMFGPPGHAYVSRAYGMHWCLNFVCRAGSAVLIRALEPLDGIAEMHARRGAATIHKLCSGPGNLCAALGITSAENGGALLSPPFRLQLGATPAIILTGKRIGITKAADAARRYGLDGSPSLSRPFERRSS